MDNDRVPWTKEPMGSQVTRIMTVPGTKEPMGSQVTRIYPDSEPEWGPCGI